MDDGSALKDRGIDMHRYKTHSKHCKSACEEEQTPALNISRHPIHRQAADSRKSAPETDTTSYAAYCELFHCTREGWHRVSARIYTLMLTAVRQRRNDPSAVQPKT